VTVDGKDYIILRAEDILAVLGDVAPAPKKEKALAGAKK